MLTCKLTKMFLNVKPLSYCVTVGCWRKKSRWGRLGPGGLKDHGNTSEESASYKQYVSRFITSFHPKTAGLRFPLTITLQKSQRSEIKELKR